MASLDAAPDTKRRHEEATTQFHPRALLQSTIARAVTALGVVAAPALALTPRAAEAHPAICWNDFDLAPPSPRRVYPAARPLPDGDRISVWREYAFPGTNTVEFVFRTGLGIDWWKGLIVYGKPVQVGVGEPLYAWTTSGHAGKGVVYESYETVTPRFAIERQDGQLTSADRAGGAPAGALRFDVHDLDRVVFAKAKFLGIHTEMYELGGPPACAMRALAGQRITFTWTQD